MGFLGASVDGEASSVAEQSVGSRDVFERRLVVDRSGSEGDSGLEEVCCSRMVLVFRRPGGRSESPCLLSADLLLGNWNFAKLHLRCFVLGGGVDMVVLMEMMRTPIAWLEQMLIWMADLVMRGNYSRLAGAKMSKSETIIRWYTCMCLIRYSIGSGESQLVLHSCGALLLALATSSATLTFLALSLVLAFFGLLPTCS